MDGKTLGETRIAMEGPRGSSVAIDLGSRTPTGPLLDLLQKNKPTMIFRLTREIFAPTGILGTLKDNEGLFSCKTLELPWKDNAANVSCIKPGTYLCVKTKSPNLGYITPELQDVPGRTHIRIHIGNYPKDILGCIAVGEVGGVIAQRPMVSSSRIAFSRLMALAPKEFTLIIVEKEGAQCRAPGIVPDPTLSCVA